MTKDLPFFKSNSRPFFLAVLSGIFIGTSYIPFNGWALLFCYIPLWLAVGSLDGIDSKTVSYQKIFALGWLTQFILTLIGFNWIYYVSSEFGLLHWSLSATALLLFAAFMHLYIPFSLIISIRIIEKFRITHRLIHFILFALVLSFLERIWPSIFEWNIAYTLLWQKWPLYQWADTVGFWGLSTWLLLFQAIIAYGFLFWKSDRKVFFQTLVFVLFIFGSLNGMGLYKQRKWLRTDRQLKIGVIQGNVGNADKVQSEQQQNYQRHILQIYSKLTDQLLSARPDTEVVLWPETAMPFALDPFFLNRLEQRELTSLVQGWNRPLITGGYSVDVQKRDHLNNALTSNAVFFLGPNNPNLAEVYDKTDLLIFGEYMPFGRQLPFLYKLLPFVGNYKTGPGPSLREIPIGDKKVRLGPQICYESLNPGFSRGLAEKGSQVLFNVTNDSWFGWWAEPYQHQLMTLARAIEVRRPLVRATNTGITSVILASGVQLENSPIGKSWSHTYEVDFLENPPLTFYTRLGHYDWLFWIVVCMALVFWGRSAKKKDPHVSH